VKLILAPHLAASLGDAARIMPQAKLERYGTAEIADGSTETVEAVVKRVIGEHRDNVVGAAPHVDAPPFTEDYWWLATVSRTGDAAQVRSFPPARAYGVDAQGFVRFEYPRDLRVADLARAIDDDNYSTSDHVLVITRAGEFGGNGHPVTSLVIWLLQEFPTILLGAGVDRLLLRHDGGKQEQLRKLAAGWAGRHIEYPHSLRKYVETRPAWYPDKLGQRLEVSSAAARRLLETLGYETSPHDQDLMEQSESARARASRSAWIDAESALTFVSLDELLNSDAERPDQQEWTDWADLTSETDSWWKRALTRLRPH